VAAFGACLDRLISTKRMNIFHQNNSSEKVFSHPKRAEELAIVVAVACLIWVWNE
jgi:hypothetical protein